MIAMQKNPQSASPTQKFESIASIDANKKNLPNNYSNQPVKSSDKPTIEICLSSNGISNPVGQIHNSETQPRKSSNKPSNSSGSASAWIVKRSSHFLPSCLSSSNKNPTVSPKVEPKKYTIRSPKTPLKFKSSTPVIDPQKTHDLNAEAGPDSITISLRSDKEKSYRASEGSGGLNQTGTNRLVDNEVLTGLNNFTLQTSNPSVISNGNCPGEGEIMKNITGLRDGNYKESNEIGSGKEAYQACAGNGLFLNTIYNPSNCNNNNNNNNYNYNNNNYNSHNCNSSINNSNNSRNYACCGSGAMNETSTISVSSLNTNPSGPSDDPSELGASDPSIEGSPVIVSNGDIGRREIFTRDEIIMIQQTWKNDFTLMLDLAIGIYQNVFEIEPSMIEFFPVLRETANPKEKVDLFKNAAFRKMSLKLVQTLDTVIRNLANFQSVVEPTLHQIGLYHVKFARDFKPSFWQSMEQGIYTGITESLEPDAAADPQIMNTWRKLIHLIITRTQSGYLEGKGTMKM